MIYRNVYWYQPLRIISHAVPTLTRMDRCASAKNTNILVLLHRFIFCVSIVSRSIFHPYPAVLELLKIAHHQRGRERLACCQHSSRFNFCHAPIFHPQRPQRDHRVPLTRCCPVGQIGHHHIHRAIRYLLHPLQAVTKHQFHDHFPPPFRYDSNICKAAINRDSFSALVVSASATASSTVPGIISR